MTPVVRLFAAAGAALVLAACASTPAAQSGAQNAVPAAGAPTIAGAIDAATAPYVASRRSKKVYPAGCATVALIKQPDRVGFASLKDAQDAGFAKDLYSTDCQY
ncbi:MAG: hypothetical protein LCH84_04715 [Gemmatimonadetes bacterium]|nr:hypothetical protein [Gemmatimonadota bacterium]